MKTFKKALALTMGTVMIASTAVTAMADGPSTTAGEANVLAYSVETVVVPTALKIAINPNQYDVTTKYVKTTDTALNAAKTYFTESSGSYTKVASPNVDNIATYYEAVKVKDQVVSLNYGIANKSTSNKTVKIDFAATYEATSSSTVIEFVDSSAKALAKSSSNVDGAGKDEMKMYLSVVAAKETPTANTYAKTADDDVVASKKYYTKSSNAYTEVASPAKDDIGSYYEATTTIGTEIQASELSDITMTKATAGIAAFAPGTTNKADAVMGFSLAKANFDLKDGEIVDFTTTQEQLADKLEMKALGGVAGFTLTGAMNTNTDWTKADATKITITPTYTIANATDEETKIDGTLNQIELTPPGPSIAQTVFTKNGSDPIEVTVNNLGEDTITDVINTDNNVSLKTHGFATVENNKVTITPTYLAYFKAGDSANIKIVTANEKELSFSINAE